MTEQEKELLEIIHESVNPKLVAEYMLSLFLDYLQKHGPAQDMPYENPLESA